MKNKLANRALARNEPEGFDENPGSLAAHSAAAFLGKIDFRHCWKKSDVDLKSANCPVLTSKFEAAALHAILRLWMQKKKKKKLSACCGQYLHI